jgi:accessory colonization factor AcfC
MTGRRCCKACGMAFSILPWTVVGVYGPGAPHCTRRCAELWCTKIGTGRVDVIGRTEKVDR